MSRAAFETRFGRSPTFASDAGGRVNLIGEHTDYHDGFVLPAALDLRTTAFGAARTDGRVRVWSENQGEEASVTLDHGAGIPGGWSGYALGPFMALFSAGIPFRGADVWLTGNVPFGGGLSSSASIEVALVGLGAALAGYGMESAEVARLAQRAEREYCSVPCGIMDQMASSCGLPGHALLLDCRSLEIRAVPFPPDWSIVVADSGVKHALASSEYALRQKECADGLDVIRATHPGIEAARDLDFATLDGTRNRMTETSFRRLRHVVNENTRTLDAARALEEADGKALGELLAASHESLAGDYEVTCPELDTLVDLAYGLDGVIGARLTGAGFGGNTVNLVESHRSEAFCRELADGYRARAGHAIRVRIVAPAGGLSVGRLSEQR